MKSSSTSIIYCIHIISLFKKKFNYLAISSGRCQMQRSATIHISKVEIMTMLVQRIYRCFNSFEFLVTFIDGIIFSVAIVFVAAIVFFVTAVVSIVAITILVHLMVAVILLSSW
jgi:hypothetical protein